MRGIGVFMVGLALILGAGRASGEDRPAATEMVPGLFDDVQQPFLEGDAFPLKTLIALHPDAILKTYLGRCLSFEAFGGSLTSRCEKRMAVSYPANDTSIRWITMKDEAIGLESTPLVDRAKDGILRFQLAKIHRLKSGHLVSEYAIGACRIDAFFNECHAIGPSGRLELVFATLGGPSTQQYPVEAAVFRIPKAEVFAARGQCLRLYDAARDATPFCATFVGRALLDKGGIMTFFTADDGRVLGFYGMTASAVSSADGTLSVPITSMLRIQGNKAGTAAVDGLCETIERAGHMLVDCTITTRREGARYEASFETVEPWRKAEPLPD